MSMIDSLLKNADSEVASALDRALSSKDISVDEAVKLFDSTGLEMNLAVIVADELRKRTVGDYATYIVNRNINFTNVCIKQCGFCAFSRDFREEEGYFLPTEEIVRRAQEAASLGATEVCIQAGLPPKMDGHIYIDICKAVKKELPDMHIHAFSPEEVVYGAVRSEMPIPDYLKMLKEAGVGSLPGTAAEILELIRSANRIPVQRSTTYRMLKVFADEKEDQDSALDKIDSSRFGSYHQLIKLDNFRYKDSKSNRNT